MVPALSSPVPPKKYRTTETGRQRERERETDSVHVLTIRAIICSVFPNPMSSAKIPPGKTYEERESQRERVRERARVVTVRCEPV